jgi:hypothetical protein
MGKAKGKADGQRDRDVDAAVEMTFPASDAPARGGATGTEPPWRPADREAPLVSKEEIEEARRAIAARHKKRS